MSGLRRGEKTLLYIDGELQETVTGGDSLAPAAVRYAEGSSHTVSAISIGKDGKARLSAVGLVSSSWRSGCLKQGFQKKKRLCGSVGNIRQCVTCSGLPAECDLIIRRRDSLVRYEYSIDGGLSWYTVVPDVDTAFSVPAEHVKLRAVFEADEGKYPAAVHWISISRYPWNFLLRHLL